MTGEYVSFWFLVKSTFKILFLFVVLNDIFSFGGLSLRL